MKDLGRGGAGYGPWAVVAVSLALAGTGLFATATPAAAIYHPNYYQWHNIYALDGAWVGQDLNEVNYYTWSDGTESVSDMYAGLYRSTQDQNLCCLNWDNPWLTNRDGSVPLSLRWGRPDCGLECEWVQDMWSGSLPFTPSSRPAETSTSQSLP